MGPRLRASPLKESKLFAKLAMASVKANLLFQLGISHMEVALGRPLSG
jgi:hypothetical protein